MNSPINNTSNSKIKNSVGKHVMISYNWANTEQVKEVIEKLEPYINVWRDKSNLTGVEDLWTE